MFFRFYRDKLSLGGARPNAAHEYLAKLEAEGKLTAVITQNIDGLHQAAGSVNVLELHGTLLRSYCAKCRRVHPTKSITDLCGAVPRCACGGIIRPDVVLYEEGLDGDVVSRAVHHIRQADLLIVGGTSLVVYPAAGLLRYYRGSELVLINKAATPYDSDATLIINDAIGEVLGAIMREEV